MIQVYDGYGLVDAEPDSKGHVVLEGDGRKLPPGSKIWLVEHGCTGWWSCDHLGITVAESGDIYSIPQDANCPSVGANE